MLTVSKRARLTRLNLVDGTKTALLSVPAKMPGVAFGLPAGPACPFKVTGEGSICGSCYAGRGNYATPIVQGAQMNRFNWIRGLMKTEAGRTEFVDTMVRAIRETVDATGEPYFRIHDSGDFFSPAYTRCWVRIVDALPEIKFWAPTRSWQAPWLPELVALAQRPNTSIRPSALYFGDAPPVVPGLDAGTSAAKVGYNCPAHAQKNECRDCRQCWTKDIKVVYRSH